MKKIFIVFFLMLIVFLCFADNTDDLLEPSEKWIGKQIIIKFGTKWDKELQNKEVAVIIKNIEKDKNGNLMLITEKPFTEKGDNILYFKWFNKKNEKHLEEWRIDKANDSKSDSIPGFIFLILLFVVGWTILIFKIIRYFNVSKFKKLFNREPVNLVIIKNGYLGLSGYRVIYTDKKFQNVLNYTYEDIYKKKIDNVFFNKLSTIKGHKDSANFFSIYEKYLKCEEYPKFRDNILNKSISLGMPMELVIYIFGNAGDKKEQVTKDKVKVNLFFGEYINRQGRSSFKLRIDFENNIVIGWKEL